MCNCIDNGTTFGRFQHMRQLWSTRPRKGTRNISTRQSLKRCRRRLDTALDIAPGTVLLHFIFVRLRITQIRKIIQPLFLCRISWQCRFQFALGFLQPVDITLRPRDIRRLAADVAD